MAYSLLGDARNDQGAQEGSRPARSFALAAAVTVGLLLAGSAAVQLSQQGAAAAAPGTNLAALGAVFAPSAPLQTPALGRAAYGAAPGPLLAAPARPRLRGLAALGGPAQGREYGVATNSFAGSAAPAARAPRRFVTAAEPTAAEPEIKEMPWEGIPTMASLKDDLPLPEYKRDSQGRLMDPLREKYPETADKFDEFERQFDVLKVKLEAELKKVEASTLDPELKRQIDQATAELKAREKKD